MFAWLASPYRTLPKCLDEPDNDAEINKTASDLPLSMRFRQLKNSVKNHVGVYRYGIITVPLNSAVFRKIYYIINICGRLAVEIRNAS